jgi:dTMP kinase
LSGFLVAFEGIDGSGKSSAAQAVAEALTQLGHEVVATREPGGTEPGREIRRLLLDSNHQLSPETELLLMCADRAEHMSRVIGPALAAGSIVITDRFAGSTRAYQGYGLGLDLTVVDAAVAIATGGINPDLTILFDVDPAIAYARRADDSANINALDVRDIAYRNRVRDGFSELARQSDCWRIIDASQPLADVIEQATAAVISAISTRQIGS